MPPPGFFDNCAELFSEGIIQYYPNTAFLFSHPDGSEELSAKNTIGFSDALSNQRPSNNIVGGQALDALLSLEIPYINEISLQDFSKIAAENQVSLLSFKKELRKYGASIDWKSEAQRSELSKELQNGVNKIESKYKKEAWKLAGSIGFGVFTTAVASLLVLNNYDELIKAIIGGGGIVPFAPTLYSFFVEKHYIDEESRADPYYLLWIIHKKE